MREKIQLSALVAMVNQEMQKYPECEDVSLTSWSPGGEAMFSAKQAAPQCTARVDRILKDLRSRYEIEGHE